MFATYSHLQWPRIIRLEKSGWTIRISKRLTFTWDVVVCVCVCVCVWVCASVCLFNIYFIIVFSWITLSVFHSLFLFPVTQQQIHYQHTYLWCILSRLCLQALDSHWRRDGVNKTRGSKEARKEGTKEEWQSESERLFSHAEWVECQNRTEV